MLTLGYTSPPIEIERTPAEHIDWCILRATDCLRRDDRTGAITGFLADSNLHPETIVPRDYYHIAMQKLEDGYDAGPEAFIAAMRGI